jgi:hypothetical protein
MWAQEKYIFTSIIMKKIKNIVMLSMVIGAFLIINSSEANVNPEVLKEYENNSAGVI